jgi:hypothetical protein
MTSQSHPVASGPPPALVALCGWLIPGAGYWMLGEKMRAAIICVVVLAVFAGGTLIGGIAVVSAPDSMSAVMDKPWFIGQALAGPISVAAAVKASRLDPDNVSTSRSWELGTLYTAIAGMLNLLVVIDATHRAVIGPPFQGTTA